MLRRLCLLIVLLFTAIAVDAQEQELYFPTAEEYIAAIPAMLSYSPPNDFGSYDGGFVSTIADDFLFRYGATAAPAELLTAFHALNYGDSLWSSYLPYLNLEAWHQRILERWIELNAIDFSTQTVFSFETYTLSANPHEIDGDAQPEWLLYAEESAFAHFWLVQTDESSASGYRLFPFPIPYRAYDFWPAQREWTGSHFYDALDLTGDGNIDFMFIGHSVMPSSGTSAGYDDLYVVSWRDGQLQQIFRGNSIVDDGQDYWQAVNLDEDAALEILQTVNYDDNYNCGRDSETIFDFVDGLYSLSSEVSTFAETVSCALRQGQEAMNAADYEQALSHFLTARERFAALNANEQEAVAETAAYANERLIVAYIMLNRIPEAIAEVEQMNQSPQAENTMAAAWANALGDGTNALELCSVAFDTLNAFEWNQNYRGIPFLGYINEAMYGEHHPNGVGDAAKASCDLFAMLQNLVYMQDYPISAAPEAVFVDLGIETTIWTYELNHDTVPERLIWFHEPNRAFFFYSTTEVFQVSEAIIWWPDENHQIIPVSLPDNQMGIATFSAYNEYDCEQGYSDEIWDETGTTDLHLYSIIDGVLTVSHPGSICLESQTIEILELGEELEIWNFREGDPAFRDSYFLPWNPETQSYAYPEPVAMLEPQQELSHPLPSAWDIRKSLYTEHDFEEALLLLDELLPSADSESLQALHYYRALALLGLERNDEALEEYIIVVDMDAFSVYGLLASLHIRIR